MKYEFVNNTHIFIFNGLETEVYKFDNEGRLLYRRYEGRPEMVMMTIEREGSSDVEYGHEMTIDYGEDYTRIDYVEDLLNDFTGEKSQRKSYAIYKPTINISSYYEDSYGNFWDKDRCTFMLSIIPQKLHKKLEFYYHAFDYNTYLFRDKKHSSYPHYIREEDMDTINKLLKKIRTQGDLLLMNKTYEMLMQANIDYHG